MRSLVLPLLLCACHGSGGTAPAIALSVQLADGRHCRDAAVTTVEISLGGTGDLLRTLDVVCFAVEAPMSAPIVGLPLEDTVDVLGLSSQGAVLYRGALKAVDHLDDPSPSATVTLYANEAR